MIVRSKEARTMGREPVGRGTRVHGRGGIGRPGCAGRPLGDRMID